MSDDYKIVWGLYIDSLANYEYAYSRERKGQLKFSDPIEALVWAIVEINTKLP